ncbi:MAG: MFS transporter, partial [Betaproteobacteria bacterium]|nr:MFS transporter [Betaproteobacteria bacterium]
MPTHTRTALTVLGACLVLNVIGRGFAESYVVFLLPVERDLGWTRSEMTSVYSIYLLVNGLSSPIVGALFDRWGPRALYTCGMASLAGAYLLAPQVHTLWQFYATIGAMTGIAGASLGMVPSSSLISRWFRERLSTAISVAFAGFGLGALFIVPAAQYLLQSHGWRESYQIMGMTLLALVPLVFFLPWKRYAEGHPEYLNPKRSSAAPERDWTVRAAMGTRMFWGLVWVFFFTAMGMFTIMVQTVVYLVEQGFSPIVAATAFGFSSMLSVVGVLGTGAIADRIGPRRIVSLTFVGSIAGVAILLLMTWFPTPSLLVAFVLVFGICQGARGPIVSSISNRLFAGDHVAAIYGVIFACNAVGAGLGSLMAGLLHDLTDRYRPCFVFAVCALFIAGLPFGRVPELRDFR